MIKTIAFDLGNTLFLQRKNSFSVRRYLNIDKKIWENKIKPLIIKSMKGKLTKKQTLQEILKNNPSNTTQRKLEFGFKKLSKDGFKPNRNLIKISKNLKKMGYKIIILSNAWHLDKENLANHKELSHFDLKILSCDVKSPKPCLKIFRYALKTSRTTPSEMIFIDNLENNVKSARILGIKSIIFIDNRQVKKELNAALLEEIE